MFVFFVIQVFFEVARAGAVVSGRRNQLRVGQRII